MMFASLLSMLMVVVMISLANASISKDVKEKVKALPAHVKQTVLGMKSQVISLYVSNCFVIMMLIYVHFIGCSKGGDCKEN